MFNTPEPPLELEIEIKPRSPLSPNVKTPSSKYRIFPQSPSPRLFTCSAAEIIARVAIVAIVGRPGRRW